MSVTRDIPEERLGEYEQLLELLLEGRTEGMDADEVRSVAERIASSALEDGHLWRAMGLSSRDELRTLMRERFRPLYEANDRDMRWKNFFYKRMCGWDGFST
jgi:nitrogen fixation protein NifQ